MTALYILLGGAALYLAFSVGFMVGYNHSENNETIPEFYEKEFPKQYVDADKYFEHFNLN